MRQLSGISQVFVWAVITGSCQTVIMGLSRNLFSRVSIQGVKSIWGDCVVFLRLGTRDANRWHINLCLCATCQCPQCPISEKRGDPQSDLTPWILTLLFSLVLYACVRSTYVLTCRRTCLSASACVHERLHTVNFPIHTISSQVFRSFRFRSFFLSKIVQRNFFC